MTSPPYLIRYHGPMFTTVLSLLLALHPPAAADDAANWREAEEATLRHHVQLTSSEQFAKAGESYFSPDGKRIIFQGIEVGEEGEAVDEFYAMYIADVVRGESDRITGIDNITRISPKGTANTCGWFHPTDPNLVLFASTITHPTESHPPGYQRGSGRYRWMFPPEMDIVQLRVGEGAKPGTVDSLEVLISNRENYIAEGSWSPDARHLIYTSLESNEGDLFTKDLKTGTITRIVTARGYDGGPFFSPDGKRITYRSDRRGTNELQLFVAELAFNEVGTIIGIEREYQLTDNAHVNWAPFWHPSGRYLVYSTSEVGHHNYEVFIIDADPGDREGSTGTIKYGTRARRITHADGFDGLPVFDAQGKWMMWTSQRSEDRTSQLWVAEFVMPVN